MLLQSKVHENLWAEAAVTSAFILNRTPKRVLNHLTPFEMLTGNKPKVKHLAPFGTHLTFLNRNAQKLSPNGSKGILLGFQEDSNNYRVLTDDNRLEITPDVIFLTNPERPHLQSSRNIASDIFIRNEVTPQQETDRKERQPSTTSTSTSMSTSPEHSGSMRTLRNLPRINYKETRNMQKVQMTT